MNKALGISSGQCAHIKIYYSRFVFNHSIHSFTYLQLSAAVRRRAVGRRRRAAEAVQVEPRSQAQRSGRLRIEGGARSLDAALAFLRVRTCEVYVTS